MFLVGSRYNSLRLIHFLGRQSQKRSKFTDVENFPPGEPRAPIVMGQRPLILIEAPQ